MTMPVEIKELVIRAVVHQEAGQEGRHGATGPGASVSSSVEPEEREAIVAAAVKEVLRILRASKER
jgi:tRNA(Ile2) C34 agmatinyltransferase TiaS